MSIDCERRARRLDFAVAGSRILQIPLQVLGLDALLVQVLRIESLHLRPCQIVANPFRVDGSSEVRIQTDDMLDFPHLGRTVGV